MIKFFLNIVPVILVFQNIHAADPHASATIEITEQIVASGIEPIGVNMTSLAGGTNFAINNLIAGSGFEPASIRFIIRVERSGSGWFEWDEGGGVHMYDQNASGFGDGADLRIYRIVDNQNQPLAYSGGLHNVTGADRVVFLGQTLVPPGGWVAEGSSGSVNRVHFADSSIQLTFGDYVMITVKKNRLPIEEVHTRLHSFFSPHVILRPVAGEFFPGTSADILMELVAHPGSTPLDFPHGDTCLQVQIPSIGNPTRSGRLGQYLFHDLDSGEGTWYSQLTPGVPYRVEVWLRQIGLASPLIRFTSNQSYDVISQPNPWTVTEEWQKFSYDFVAPAYPLGDIFHHYFALEITGPGTVWIDNFMVFHNDLEHGQQPLTPHQTSVSTLMDAFPQTGSKPLVRFFRTTYKTHAPVDQLLGQHLTSNLDFIYNMQSGTDSCMTIPQVLEWCLATGNHASGRVVPGLTLSEEYTEIEWMAIIEFLGVPYVEGIDTPASKPWAYRRFQQRGHGNPWTDDFREIIIEFGNETWHQGVGGFGWNGFGRPTWAHHHLGGIEYGLFAHYYFYEQVASMPWWSEYNLQEKIKFNLNASYAATSDAYGESAAQRAPETTSYIGHANYVGPKWETGDTPFSTFDDHAVQETLVGAKTNMYTLIDEIQLTQVQLASSGLADYRPMAYEGGPSGYFLPGSGTPTQVEVSEQLGKSLGSAVSALDVWLYSSLKGFAHQCHYAFNCGNGWTSHTMPEMGQLIPNPTWLALKMRNLFAPGSQMWQTEMLSVPTYARSGEDIPLISAYTISDVDQVAVFILSHKLDGIHDGVDFGDGSTPVTLQLPFPSCQAITRYALTQSDGTIADPRTNNRTQQGIFLTEENIPTDSIQNNQLVINPQTGGVTGGMPHGTIFLYVFKFNSTCSLDGAVISLWPGPQFPTGLVDQNGNQRLDIQDILLNSSCL